MMSPSGLKALPGKLGIKIHSPTVLSAKSDSDVIFCIHFLSKTLLYTPLELTGIVRSLVY